MISQLTTTTLTDRPVVAACPLGISLSLNGTGLSAASALMPVLPVRERIERSTGASAVAAAKAQASAYAFAAAAKGAGAETAKGAESANGQLGGSAFAGNLLGDLHSNLHD